MLLNVLLFWLMVAEGAVCLVLCLPVGQSASLAVINFLSRQFGGRDSKASTAVSILLAVVSLLFLSDVSTVYKHHASDEVLSDGLRIRLLTAQRNMYISGFCLFLFLLLRLVYISMATNIRLDKSLNAMKKQAENAAAGYKALLEENESVKKQAAKIKQLLSDDGEDADKKRDVLAKLMEENAKLATQVEATGKELKQAEAKVLAVKKQAEGQSSEFMKLLDEKVEADKQTDAIKKLEEKVKQQAEQLKALTEERDSLRSQIQDYDFMFAEAKKKAE